MNNNLLTKAKLIKLAIFDVDGVLTDGLLAYSSNGIEEYKEFHVHDGLGLKLLMQAEIEVAIITSKQSELLLKRMNDLGVKHIFQDQANKLPAYESLKKQLNLTDNAIAYTGDDLPDLALIRKAGLGITVPNAPAIIQQHASWVTTKKAGRGAVREICDFILTAQNKYDTLVERFM